jgi:hypothetical protein
LMALLHHSSTPILHGIPSRWFSQFPKFHLEARLILVIEM